MGWGEEVEVAGVQSQLWHRSDSIREARRRAGEMAQQLRPWLLCKGRGSVPSTYMAAHNYLPLQF